MAALTTADRAELVVKNANGDQLAIVPNSIVVTSGAEFLAWSPIYGNGQIDVLGNAAGTASITVTLGASSGTLEVTVTEAAPGELVVTLGPVRPK